MKARGKRKFKYDLMSFKTYEELKAFTLKHPMEFSPEENWSIVERMRQLRYGYKPGELKMVKTLRELSVDQHRKKSEREYAAEIKKYGPR